MDAIGEQQLSGHNRGAARNIIGEQQLKQTRNWGAAAKLTQSDNSMQLKRAIRIHEAICFHFLSPRFL